jgi:hypothetical protein
MTRITVLAFFDRISVYHSLKPFLNCRQAEIGEYSFTVTDSPDYCLTKDRNQILIILRRFLKPDKVDFELLEKLRSKYDRIAYFNGHPGGGLHHSEVLPYVDLFFNKSLWKDRREYLLPHYGDELYTDFYHKEYGVVDDPDVTAEPVADENLLSKLRLSWNVGVGDFPRPRLAQRAGVFFARTLGIGWSRPFSKRQNPPPPDNPGTIPVHARLGFQKRNTLAAQRRIIMEKIENHPDFLTTQEKVPQKQYNQEVGNSKIVLSPFGLGELCFRDFEAVQSNALLVKPDMSHIETWPDVFVAGETYVPIRWDAEDLVETCEYYLAHDTERNRIVENAYDAYRAQLASLCERFSETLRELAEQRP